MKNTDKDEIIKKAKNWFRNNIAIKHITNTKKLINVKKFDINPFTSVYLSKFLTGTANADGIARALIYPRVLGTSIATTFGSQIQKFTGSVLEAFGSTTPGIDIEFIDQIDNLKKYCQLKAGPNTINKDGAITINNYFISTKRLAKANNLDLKFNQLVVGIVYGEKSKINTHYKNLENKYNYDVIVGVDFWHRLTGDPNFYYDLIAAITEVAIESNFKDELEEIIEALSRDPEITSIISRIPLKKN